MLICRAPMVMVVPGLANSRPWASNSKTPAGAALIPVGAELAIASPVAPSSGVGQVVSLVRHALPAGACCAAL